jgi:hypothetical protein
MDLNLTRWVALLSGAYMISIAAIISSVRNIGGGCWPPHPGDPNPLDAITRFAVSPTALITIGLGLVIVTAYGMYRNRTASRA